MPKGIYEPIGVGSGSGGGVGSSGRTVLTGNASYDVNSATGNDTPGPGPYKTLQYAWNYLSATLDGAGFNLTINCAGAGPYTGNFANSWVGFGSVIILGAGSATTSYQNMYFSANPLGAIIFLDSCNLTANLGAASQDWCVQNSGSGYVLVGLITNDYLVTCGDGVVIAFGATSPGAQIGLFGSTTVTGAFTNILSVSNGGFIFNVGNHTISGSPQCFDGFVNASTIGCIKDSGSWTGALHTGAQPFVVGSNGSIQVTNANPTFYPGDQPGIILDPTGSYVGINEDEVLPRQNVAVPTTGGTVNMALLTPNQILNPASTLATLTVNLPPITNIPEGPWAIDNVIAVISNMSAHTITALTVGVTDASTLVGAPTTLPPYSGFAMQYDKTTTTWSPWVIGAGGSSGLVINSTTITGGGGNPGVGTSGYFLWNPNGAGVLEDSDDGGTGTFYRNDAGFTGFDTLGTQNCFAQRGDTDGVSALYIRNRNGSNGGIFQNFSLDLVDLGFNPSSNTQSNFRLEHRVANLINASNSAGEFQFINAGSSAVWLASGPGVTSLITPLIPGSYIVSALPTPIAGMRATVTDSTVALSGAAIGSAPIGSGAHTVPVFANETPAWVIG
jgi:hypothetical protein